MNEVERKARNASRMAELHPVFRAQVAAILAEMEREGYRPRIQEAWRSPELQAAAFHAGTSKLKYGFHNVTAEDGTKEALAADILDDNHAEDPRRDYILHLAAAALRTGCMTGAFFGLNEKQKNALYKALVDSSWNAAVSTGWDPCHVQVLGITVEEAQAGKRPADPNAPPVGTTTTVTGTIPGTTTTPAPGMRHFRVTEVETGRTEAFEMATPLRPVSLLAVPWVSMLGPGADLHSNDSAAACGTMLLRAYLNLVMTPDDFFVRFSMPEDKHLGVTRMRNALGGLGLLTDFRKGLHAADLFSILQTGKPAMVFMRYRALATTGLTESRFEGAHSALVVGIDAQTVYLHDPLYQDRAGGEGRAYPLAAFLQAWKDAAQDPELPQPEYAAIVPLGAIGARLSRRAKVTAENLNVRAAPQAAGAPVAVLKKGNVVEIRREVSGWGELGVNRWISLKFIDSLD